MTELESAFEVLLARVRAFQLMPLHGMTKAELEEEESLIVALGALSFQSMCGPPESCILEARVPLRRLELPQQPAQKLFPGVRHDLECPDCKEAGEVVFMVFREVSKFGPFYGCPRYPSCKASHGAHPDGAPLGVPANKATKAARVEAHAWFDRLWKGKDGLMNRRAAYSWMQEAMGMTPEQAHIGNFDVPTCARLVELVKKQLVAKECVSGDGKPALAPDHYCADCIKLVGERSIRSGGY